MSHGRNAPVSHSSTTMNIYSLHHVHADIYRVQVTIEISIEFVVSIRTLPLASLLIP